MAKLGLKSQFVQRALGLGLVAGIFVSLGGRPYAQTPTQAARDAGESCIEALGYLGCDALVHPGAAQQKIVIYWGALAISELAMKAGASRGDFRRGGGANSTGELPAGRSRRLQDPDRGLEPVPVTRDGSSWHPLRLQSWLGSQRCGGRRAGRMPLARRQQLRGGRCALCAG
jgi:hypothetical protein